MHIKSIELENIRSYQKQKIEFEEGINFLSGDIGSGKSSILQAIEFALFGFKRGDLEGFQLLRKGEREASVKLILQNRKNQQIEIFRKIKKGKTNDNISQENGHIIVENNLLELSPQEINSQVFEILNFPKEFLTKDKNLIYRFTIYTPQEQLKEVLFAENEKRLEIIRKIFQIDKYKQIKDAISIYSSKIRENKKVYQVKLEPQLELKQKNKQLEEELKIILEKIKNLEEKEKLINEKSKKYKDAILKREHSIEKIDEAIIETEKKIAQIEEIENSNKKLKKELEEKEELIKKFSTQKIEKQKLELNQKIKEKQIQLENINKSKNQIQENNNQLEKLNLEKDNLQQKINEHKNKKELFEFQKKDFDYILTTCQLKDLENEISKIKSSIKKKDKIEIEIKEIETQIIKLELETENLNLKINENKTKKLEIKDLTNCPTCLQEVCTEHKEDISKKLKINLEEFENKTQNNLKTIKQNKEQLKQKQNELEKYIKEEKELTKKEEKYIMLQEKEKQEKIKYEQLKKLKTQILEIEKLNAEKQLETLNNQIQENKNIKNQLDEISKKEIQINNQISNIKIELLNLENNHIQYQNSKKEIQIIKTNIEENLKKITKKDQHQEKLKQEKENQIKIKQEKEKIKKIIEEFAQKDKLISNALSSYKTQITSKTKEIEEIELKLKQLKQDEENYNKLLKKENTLTNKLVKISEIIEMKLFTKYYVEFNEEFEKLFKELIEDNEIEVRLNEEFSPIIEQNGYDINITNLSGGEKSSLAVAYRLGLKKIIENNLSSKQKLSLLILDEPTDGFSNEQIDRLGNILKETGLKQTILVSHDAQIESISDKILHVEKVNHVSFVK